MANWLASLTGLLRGDGAPIEPAPAPQPIRMVPGGPAARELCMLPVEWDGIAAAAEQERATRVRDVRLVQIKADGINAVGIDGMIVGGRDGAPLNCALQCVPGLARVERALGEETVFFGEYVALDGFNATLAEHKRGEGEGTFWIYDAMPFAHYLTGKPYDVAIEQRLDRLRAAVLTSGAGPFVGFLDFWLLDAGETLAKAQTVWADGFEGLVRKRLGSPLVRDRSPDWQKVKQRLRRTCAVVDTIHRDGKLRSIIVREWEGGPITGAATGKPITITGGWSQAEGESIDIGMAEGSQGRLVEIEFGLTSGATRTIRSPKFKGLLA